MRLPNMTTAPNCELRRRDFHPLVQQLVSLHPSLPDSHRLHWHQLAWRTVISHFSATDPNPAKDRAGSSELYGALKCIFYTNRAGTLENAAGSRAAYRLTRRRSPPRRPLSRLD